MFGIFRLLRGKKAPSTPVSPQTPSPPESPFDETAEGSWEPGIVQFALDGRMFRIIMLPGSGQADGGTPLDVAMEVIPFELRRPNQRIMALRREGRIVRVQAPGPKARLWFESYVDRPNAAASPPKA